MLKDFDWVRISLWVGLRGYGEVDNRVAGLVDDLEVDHVERGFVSEGELVAHLHVGDLFVLKAYQWERCIARGVVTKA